MTHIYILVITTNVLPDKVSFLKFVHIYLLYLHSFLREYTEDVLELEGNGRQNSTADLNKATC